MKLSIVIPCYNEAATIRQIVERVRAAPVTDMEIIVDNCSRGQAHGSVKVPDRTGRRSHFHAGSV